MEDAFLKPGLSVTLTQGKTQEMRGGLCLPEQRDIGLLCRRAMGDLRDGLSSLLCAWLQALTLTLCPSLYEAVAHTEWSGRVTTPAVWHEGCAVTSQPLRHLTFRNLDYLVSLM